MGIIITIDGPSGVGKSTVSRILAKILGYRYIDTGAMYRGVAYAFVASGYSLESIDDGRMETFLNGLDLEFHFDDTASVFYRKEDISEKIREPEISLIASKLSQNRKVREYLTGKQREIGRPGGVVLEGRDTGSVVFPDAHVKFFLDADHEERARRRHLELKEKGKEANIDTVKEEISIRDRQDSQRELAPLVRPKDSVYIDTTRLDINGVVEEMLKYILPMVK
ncbi:MAG: (d)CMP kinase [Syntrophorhabdaceae bacterium]|nr:(d)CMP kinase [Syntrophorhabdaceae bacterium]